MNSLLKKGGRERREEEGRDRGEESEGENREGREKG